MMSFWRLIIRSLVFHRRMNAAVALGVIAGTAVLTGALLVGDSVRGSLRHLALDRLGRIDDVLVADRFFRPELTAELAAEPEFQKHFAEAQPAILVQGTVETADSEHRRRAGEVTVLGCDERFWKLGDGGPKHLPGPEEIVLNEPLAVGSSRVDLQACKLEYSIVSPK